MGDEFLEDLDLRLDRIAVALRGALDRREQLAMHDQRDHEPLAALPRPLDPILVDLHVGRVIERRPAAEPQLLSVGGLGHRPTRGRQRAVARESPVEDGADRPERVAVVDAVLVDARAQVLDRTVHVAGQQPAEPRLGHRVAVQVRPAPQRRMERRRLCRLEADGVDEESVLAGARHLEADLGLGTNETLP